MHNPPTGQHHPVKTKRRRRWPWITSAVVLAIFVLAGIFGNKPQTTGTPTVGTAGTVATASATSTTPTTTVDLPVTTTTVAPPVATTTPPQVVAAPRTTHQAAPKPVPPPVIAPPPVVAPPVVPPAPVAGKYHAGEFCSHVGATAISTTGVPMTCLQEGNYKRWHNN
jgi:hypothetical protein